MSDSSVPELIITRARAYVYSGEWVADCTRKGCGNVEFLYTPLIRGGPRVIRKPFFTCSYCGEEADISWSSMENEIMEVLTKRPIPSTRNWYPEGHETAVRFQVPHGQTISDLKDENVANGVEA